MLKHIHISILLVLTVAGLAPDAAAQQIESMDIDTVLCVGDSLHISTGFGPGHNVVLSLPTASISHPQTTFLPDGVICDSTLGTCTYRSPITFSAFRSNAIITSAQDIDFVRLNIEHSWMSDIFIALECPNGQFASLMNTFHALGNTTAGASPANISMRPTTDSSTVRPTLPSILTFIPI